MGQVAGPELTGKVCPYCRFPLKEGASIETCGACGAIHHAECWQDNAGCSVTGCVNGPSNTTATHVVPPAAVGAGAIAAAAMPTGAAPPAAFAAPPTPPPPGSSKPPPPPQRRFPTAAVVAGAILIALLGAGAAVAISSSSKKASQSTITVKERTVEKAPQSSPTVTRTTQAPTHQSTPAPAPTPAPTGPSDTEREGHAVEAVDTYWGDIENHDFPAAYQIEAPSAGSGEPEWVHTEEAEGVEKVSYNFEPGGLEGNEATVDVGSLRTEASKTGCYTWTGSYRLTDYGGTWKITHDGLERHSC